MNPCDARGCPRMPYKKQRYSHCTVCHMSFRSHEAGDDHRHGPYDPAGLRVCLTEVQMWTRAWVRDEQGFWGGLAGVE